MAEQWTIVGGVVVQSANYHVASFVCDFMPHELGTSELAKIDIFSQPSPTFRGGATRPSQTSGGVEAKQHG
jgi:hypothetical protein